MLGIVCSFFVPQEKLTVILTNILYCIFKLLGAGRGMRQCNSQCLVVISVTRVCFKISSSSDIARPLLYPLECFFKMVVFYFGICPLNSSLILLDFVVSFLFILCLNPCLRYTVWVVFSVHPHTLVRFYVAEMWAFSVSNHADYSSNYSVCVLLVCWMLTRRNNWNRRSTPAINWRGNRNRDHTKLKTPADKAEWQ